MASPAPVRTRSLEPTHWIRAALARLVKQGIHEVRVEVLARDLGVSKGSFYWHFRDRGELLEKLLALWEDSELAWLNDKPIEASAATRWAKLIERATDPDRIRMEVAIRAWARGDGKVAAKLVAIERKRAHLIADVLREVGFARAAAESWSELVSLVCVGWMDRATRDPQFQYEQTGLGEVLSDVLLAASTRSPGASR